MKIAALSLIMLSALAIAKEQLIGVIVLARHGARTPFNSSDDPFQKDDPWVYDASLTRVGTQQHFTIGKYLRHVYSARHGLISDIYDPKELKIVSSNT
jgi:hypothetical protein